MPNFDISFEGMSMSSWTHPVLYYALRPLLGTLKVPNYSVVSPLLVRVDEIDHEIVVS